MASRPIDPIQLDNYLMRFKRQTIRGKSIKKACRHSQTDQIEDRAKQTRGQFTQHPGKCLGPCHKLHTSNQPSDLIDGVHRSWDAHGKHATALGINWQLVFGRVA